MIKKIICLIFGHTTSNKIIENEFVIYSGCCRCQLPTDLGRIVKKNIPNPPLHYGTAFQKSWRKYYRNKLNKARKGIFE